MPHSWCSMSLKRIGLVSPAVDVAKADPATIPLTYRLARRLAPPYCELAKIKNSFDFRVLQDLKGDKGWLDVTKSYDDVYHDAVLDIYGRRKGWDLPYLNHGGVNTTLWLPNEPRAATDSTDVPNAAIFVPGSPSGLATAPSSSSQPGAYYACCLKLNADELSGTSVDSIRGVFAEQLAALSSTSSSPTSSPTNQPTRSPSVAPATSPPTRAPNTDPTTPPTMTPSTTPGTTQPP